MAADAHTKKVLEKIILYAAYMDRPSVNPVITSINRFVIVDVASTLLKKQ